jgi:hypothetical protein
MPSLAELDRRSGVLYTIDFGAVTSKQHKQYTQYDTPLKEIVGAYGYCNVLAVTNNSLTVDLLIKPEFDTTRQVFCPAGTITKIDNTVFRSFDIFNTTTNTDSTGKIYLLVGWQPQLGSSLTLAGLR